MYCQRPGRPGLGGWELRSEPPSTAGTQELWRLWASFQGAGGGERRSFVPECLQMLPAAVVQVWPLEMRPGVGSSTGKLGANNPPV